ncbi:MAG TPA: maleylpyruvate isomerase family mycothiol-dependent enzyme [Acidimicrobiia bacterium]|jgi:uncharacterized protein (TIGR03083 family)
MALPRTQVSDGLLDELERFEALLLTISAAEWEQPTRCAGWTVGDVARHTVGSIADVVSGRLDGLGTEEVTAREVAERKGRTSIAMAGECAEVRKGAAGMLPLFDDAAWAAPAPGGYEGTLGDGVEALWYDTWMHGDDIRAALGRPVELGPAVPGALSHIGFELTKLGWNGPVPAAGDADAHAFLMVASGRAAAATYQGETPLNVYA